MQTRPATGARRPATRTSPLFDRRRSNPSAYPAGSVLILLVRFVTNAAVGDRRARRDRLDVDDLRLERHHRPEGSWKREGGRGKVSVERDPRPDQRLVRFGKRQDRRRIGGVNVPGAMPSSRASGPRARRGPTADGRTPASARSASAKWVRSPPLGVQALGRSRR